MNCIRFRDLVHDLAREEALDSELLRETLEHAENCMECDALLDEAEALTLGLRGLADRYATIEAPDRVQSSLLLALRHNQRPVIRDTRSRKLGAWVIASSAGIAAMVLFGLTLFHTHGRPEVVAADQSVPSGVLLPKTSSGSSGPVEEANAAASLDSDAALDLSEDWPLTYQETTEAAGFMPLTQAFDPQALDSSAIVRVALSKPALRNLGLYLDDLQNDGTVIADLAVSSDGTPEAIRVVWW